jgi:hypothetical protein
MEELGICRGQVRIDLVVVNGVLHGYEIKSDRDSLRRLASQADIYSKVLDRMTLVVGQRHLEQAMSIVPSWWGVLRIEACPEGPRFKTVRRNFANPQRDVRSLVELLWLDDAIALLEERDVARGLRGKPRRVVWDAVCHHCEASEIGVAVRTKLKSRATTAGSPSQP